MATVPHFTETQLTQGNGTTLEVAFCLGDDTPEHAPDLSQPLDFGGLEWMTWHAELLRNGRHVANLTAYVNDYASGKVYVQFPRELSASLGVGSYHWRLRVEEAAAPIRAGGTLLILEG